MVQLDLEEEDIFQGAQIRSPIRKFHTLNRPALYNIKAGNYGTVTHINTKQFALQLREYYATCFLPD